MLIRRNWLTWPNTWCKVFIFFTSLCLLTHHNSTPMFLLQYQFLYAKRVLLSVTCPVPSPRKQYSNIPTMTFPTALLLFVSLTAIPYLLCVSIPSGGASKHRRGIDSQRPALSLGFIEFAEIYNFPWNIRSTQIAPTTGKVYCDTHTWRADNWLKFLSALEKYTTSIWRESMETFDPAHER
jgi:hypothetical protein